MAQENKTQNGEIRYLNPVSVDVKKKKYCRFKKLGIKYVDYKDGELRPSWPEGFFCSNAAERHYINEGNSFHFHQKMV